MANAREIKLRIKGINETKKITKAMKLISASKLKKARAMHEATMPFFRRVQDIMTDILAHLPDIESVYFDTRINKENKKSGYIVVASDKGLNGGYNHNILKLATSVIDKEKYIVVKTRFEAHKIYHKDIIYIKKQKGEKYAVFCTPHGEYTERSSLEQIIKELNSDKFIMVERGYIVNYHHILCVKGNEIHLSNKEKVEISRAKITTVKEQIFNCWEKMQ